mgnify:CR=1 FL=1
MIEARHKLRNGNFLIWLGNQPIDRCEHVLLLAGGDVLFLQTVKTLPGNELRADLAALSQADFIKKRRWPNNSSSSELYQEVKKWNQRQL